MSKPTPFHITVQTAEDEALPVVRASRSNLINAQALQPVAAREVDLAEDEVDAIEREWRDLKEGRTPAEHAAALSAFKKAEVREQGAKRWLQSATREASSSDKLLANAMIPIVERALVGVTAISTFAEITSLPRAAELPLMLVIQHGETTIRDTGSISGEVLLRYFSGDIHRDLDINALDVFVAAALTLDCEIEIQGRPMQRAAGVEEIKVRVRHANLDVPFLPVIHPTAIQRLAGAFVAELATDCAYYLERVEADPQNLSYATQDLLAMPGDTRVASDDVDEGDGTRTLVLETSVLVERRKAISNPTLPERVRDIAERFASGTHIGGLGVIDSLELLYGEGAEGLLLEHSTLADVLGKASGLPVRVETLGFETVHQFCFRAVMKSTTRRPHVEAGAEAAEAA